MRMIKMPRVWQNRAFRYFFFGNGVSLFGFGIHFIAVAWIVLDRTGSEMAVAKLFTLAHLPGLVVALYGGVIIDRVNRKHLLIFLDLFRGVSVLSVPIAFWAGYDQLWIVYVMEFLVGTGHSIFWSSANAFVQEVVNEKNIMQANSFISASYQTGSLAGSAAGGFFIAAFGPVAVLLLDSATYFFSAIMLWQVDYTPTPTESKTKTGWQNFRDGLSLIREKYSVFLYMFMVIMADVAIWGGMTILTVSYSNNILGTGAQGFGLMDGFYGLGALIASWMVLSFFGRWQRSTILLVCYGIAAITTFLLPVMPLLKIAIILHFFMGLGNNSARILTRTIFMEKIPNEYMGRATTVTNIYSRLMIISMLSLVGWAIETGSVGLGYFINGLHFVIAFAGVLIVMFLKKNFFDVPHLVTEVRI